MVNVTRVAGNMALRRAASTVQITPQSQGATRQNRSCIQRIIPNFESTFYGIMALVGLVAAIAGAAFYSMSTLCLGAALFVVSASAACGGGNSSGMTQEERRTRTHALIQGVQGMERITTRLEGATQDLEGAASSFEEASGQVEETRESVEALREGLDEEQAAIKAASADLQNRLDKAVAELAQHREEEGKLRHQLQEIASVTEQRQVAGASMREDRGAFETVAGDMSATLEAFKDYIERLIESERAYKGRVEEMRKQQEAWQKQRKKLQEEMTEKAIKEKAVLMEEMANELNSLSDYIEELEQQQGTEQGAEAAAASPTQGRQRRSTLTARRLTQAVLQLPGLKQMQHK